jgi:MHS family proline/betaine transporter-like MFS transporter
MNKLKLIICATFGNCFEVYDFIIYQLLANHISNHFFDRHLKNAFLLTQLIFILTAILSRPIGGLIFGYLADLKGRKLSLEKSILMSGVCTGMIGLIPSYETIGLFSTLFLILLRFLQGVSLGGEQGTSISFLLEHSSPKSRGFLSSFCCFGQQIGVLVAVAATSIYSLHISKTGMSEQLWRILFVLSFGFGWFGYWVRKKTNETIDFLLDSYCSEEKTSLVNETKLFILNNKALFMSIFFIVSLGTFMSYTVFIIGNGYLKQQANSLAIFKYIQYIMSFSVILSIPIFGFYSDKIGRKTIISHSILIISALSIPFFQSLQSVPSYTTLIVAVLLAISCGAYFSVTPTIIAETLPTKSRCINYAIFYTIPAAIISGITPFLSNWFIKTDPIYLSYVTIGLAISSIISLRLLEEPLYIYGKLPKYSYEFLKP